MNASIIYTAMAVLEVVAAGVSLARGDSEYVRSCCVMGMLCIIAAGVWRKKP